MRLASVPPEHPLYKPVKLCKGRYIKWHRTPLHLLLNQTTFDPKCIEKIPAKPRNPAEIGKLPFTVSIAISKEASILEDRNVPETIKVYSDGLACEGKVGAAVILTCLGKPHWVLHYHLSSESEHTVPEAELIGIILAMQLIKTEKNNSTPIAIGTDNQAAIEAFDTSLRNPVHNVAQEIIRLGYMLQKHTKHRKYLLTLRWTAGHIGIPGNESADKEAKRAAEGLSSDKNLLPTFLKRSLTINPLAVQRSKNAEIKRKWNKKWKKSRQGKLLTKTDKSSPSANFQYEFLPALMPINHPSPMTPSSPPWQGFHMFPVVFCLIMGCV